MPGGLTTRSRRPRIAGYQAIRRAAQTGTFAPISNDPDEQRLNTFVAARNAGASSEILRQISKPEPRPNRFFKLLESISLPFEAFAEGVNALIGPIVPQEKFRERSAVSRETLAAMFKGDISPAEAAGALRETHRERSMVEQLLTGFLFDPLNILVPGAIALRTGARAGVLVGARAGAKGGIEFAAPIVGRKAARALGLVDEVPEELLRRLDNIPEGAAGLPDVSDPNFAKQLVPNPSTMEVAVESGTRPNRLMQRAKQKASEGDLFWKTAMAIIEPITLRGAGASGVMRALNAHRGRLFELQGKVDLSGDILSTLPGFKEMEKVGFGLVKLSGNKRSVAQFYDVKVRKNAPFTDFLTDETAKRQLMQHQKALFDGVDGVPLERLDEFYDLTANQKEYITAVRQWVAEGTSAVETRAPGMLTELIKGPPKKGYFPLLEERVRITDLTKKRPLQASEWANERTVGFFEIVGGSTWKANDALQVRYLHHLSSASNYVGDVMRQAMDREMLDFLRSKGLLQDTAVFGERLKIAEGLDRLLAASIKGTSNRAAEVKKLLGFEGSADNALAQMGRLGKELLEATPTQAKALEEPVNDLIRTIRLQEDAARKMKADLKGLVPDRAEFLPLKASEKVLGAPLREWKMAWEYFHQGDKNFVGMLRSVNEKTTMLRFMQAGFDASAMLIHGAVMLLTDPVNWTKATKKSLQAIVDPEVLALNNAAKAPIASDFLTHGGVLGFSEPTEALGSLDKFFGNFGAPGRVMQSVTKRAEASFTAWQDEARMLMWESLRGMAKTQTEGFELARFVNKATGVYNPAYAGLPEMQKYIESSALMFAPMYRRAAFGLLADAMSTLPGRPGTLNAKLAQKKIGLLIASGTIFFGAIPNMLGNDRALDPRSPQFLTYKIGERFVGIGTAYYSLVRMLVSVTEQAMDEEKRAKLGRFDIDDNKLLRWWRSQAPPLPAAAIDLITGKSYIGEPLRGEDGSFSPALVAKWASRQITPIAVEALINEVRGFDDYTVMAEGFGARSFPESPLGVLFRAQNNIALTDDDADVVKWRTSLPKEDEAVFSAMPKLLQAKMREKHPELDAVSAEWEKDQLSRGKAKQKSLIQYRREADRNRTTVRDGMDGVGRAFRKGDLTAEEFRGEIRRWQGILVELQRALADRPENFEAISVFEDARKRRSLNKSTFWGDIFYDQYFQQVVLNPLLTNEDGIFQPDIWRRLNSLFRAEVGTAGWDYVQDRREAQRDVPDLIQDYFDEREITAEYWDLPKTLWKEGSDNLELLEGLQDLPQRAKDTYRLKHPSVRVLEARLQRARERFRSQHPDIDWLLVKWYDAAPQTRFAEQRLAEWQLGF